MAGATPLNVAGGLSGFPGALAPELALAGVTAQPNAIEEASGHLVGDGFRPEAVTEALREVIRGGGQERQRYGWTPSRPALQMSRRVIEAREQRRHAR